jgi:hypothetical protein
MFFLIIFSFLFFVLRLPFISSSLLFFDSPQYAERLLLPNFWQAIVSGHPPLHSGYILVLWPIAQIAKFFSFDPILTVKVFSVFLGFFGFLALFHLLKNIFNKNVALKILFLLAFTPILWLANLDLLVVNVYFPFFFFSLFAGFKALTSGKLKYFFLTGIFLMVIFLTHSITLIYWPGAFLFLISFSKTKDSFKKLFSSFFMAFLLANFFLFSFYTLGRGMTASEAFYWLFLGKLNEHAQFFPLWLGFLRIVRNFVLVFCSNFTVIFTIAGLAAFFIVFKKRGRKLASALFIWFLPAILAAQWWDGLLQGRHLILATLPLAIAVALSFKKLYPVILVNLVVAGLGAVLLTKPPTPQELVNRSLEKLPQNGIYLESHFWRPWTKYPNAVFINEPFWPKEKIKEIIENALGDNVPIFVSSQALSEPYGLYSGPVLHPLTLSFRNPPTLKFLEESYYLAAVATVSAEKHLVIYKIEAGESKIGFKRNSATRWSRERVDFWDPVIYIFSLSKNCLVK